MATSLDEDGWRPAWVGVLQRMWLENGVNRGFPGICLVEPAWVRLAEGAFLLRAGVNAKTERQSAKVLFGAGQRSASVATWPIGSVCPLEAAGKFYVFLDVVLAEGRISAAHWVNESGLVSRTSRNNAWLSSENTKEKGQNPRRCWVFWPSCEYLKNSITCSKWWCSVCYRTTRYWDQ
jgi:hypothetical protein